MRRRARAFGLLMAGAAAAAVWAGAHAQQAGGTAPPTHRSPGSLLFPSQGSGGRAQSVFTGANFHGPVMVQRENTELLVLGPLLMRQAIEHAEGGPPPVVAGP